jgi:hypothetical protein
MTPRTFTTIVLGLIAVEVASYFAWQYPTLGVLVWLFLVGLVFALTLVQPEFGIAAILAELVLGGKGYLFVLPLGTDVSLRLGLFLAVLAGWAFLAFRRKNFWGEQWRFRWLWLGLVTAVAWATIVGLFRGHGLSSVFFDVNAFFFLGLVPAFGLLKTRAQYRTVLFVIAAAVVVLALKTALVQGLYSHYPSTSLGLLYKWVRGTGVGEVTHILGRLYRVFFQSHVYGLFAFFTGIGLAIADRRRQWAWTAFAGLGAYVVVVSLSRSFWLGGAVAFGLSFLVMLSWRSFRRGFATVALTSAVALCFAYVGFQWTLNFPGLWGGSSSSGSLVRSRTEYAGESAFSSRKELLPAMHNAILEHPLIGSGFGTPVTYNSKDPRVNASRSPHGTPYTTTSFELGYHAFALQFGLPFTLLVLGLLWWFLWQGVTMLRLQSAERPIVAGLICAAVALAVLHLTTPYLNHPLGIGMLMCIAAGLSIFDPRYAKR